MNVTLSLLELELLEARASAWGCSKAVALRRHLGDEAVLERVGELARVEPQSLTRALGSALTPAELRTLGQALVALAKLR